MYRAQGGLSSDAAKRILGAIGLCLIFNGCAFKSQNTSPQSSRASIGWERLRTSDPRPPGGILSVSLPAPMLPAPTLVMTPEVQVEINSFLGRERNFLERSMERRAQYLPMLEQIFRDEGVPDELLALALVESGYNTEARSPVGAVGMWQFMRATARLYGLKVQRNEDQRRDAILATLAAARHLRDLYFAHGDWHLAIAAYNAGTGGVAKALSRAGCEDYWTLIRKRKLTLQTQRFVPRFIAAALIARGLKNGSSLTQLAAELGVQNKEKDGIEVANWSGHRHTSPG